MVRDKNTNAILNVNYLEYENYNKSNLLKEKENARFEKMESEILTLKDDLNLIKQLLLEIKNGPR